MNPFSMNIREWYLETFPTDELGLEISESVDFEGLFRVLDTYGDVYEFIGVADSLVRERLFERLAQIMECDYDVIYQQWLWAR